MNAVEPLPLVAAVRPDLAQWRRIRTVAMPGWEAVEAAAAAREAGDWRAAAAAARADVDIDLRTVRNDFGARAAEAIEDDLRHMALDLLWWHLPRHRGGMTTVQAQASAVLVPRAGAASGPLIRVRHPHAPRGPQRLTVTVDTAAGMQEQRWYVAPRHTWDVREAGFLRERWGGSPDRTPLFDTTGHRLHAEEIGTGTDRAAATERVYQLLAAGDDAAAWAACGVRLLFDGSGPVRRKAAAPACPVGVTAHAREVAEALNVPEVSTLFGGYLTLAIGETVIAEASDPFDWFTAVARIPIWGMPPDLALVHAGLLAPGDLHPLIRVSLFPAAGTAGGTGPAAGQMAVAPVRVRCAGMWHEVSVRGGALYLHDHDEHELRRERVLRALGGTAHGCFAVRAGWDTGATRLPRALADRRRELTQRLLNGETDWLLHGLERGDIDPNARDSNGWTLMHMLMWVDHDRVLPVLLAHGLPIDAPDRIGRTPLYVAVMNGGTPDLIKRLLAEGANPMAATVHGATPAGVADYHAHRNDLPFLAEMYRPRR